MNQRINILYLIRTWALGGSHTIVLSLLKHLPPERFHVLCIPYDTPSGSDERFVEAARKQGTTIPDDRIPWRSRVNWLKARDTVEALVREHSIDLLHTHDPHSNVLIGLGRRRWQCACVASAYGWFKRWLPLRSHIYTWLEQTRALPQFDRVTTVSNDMKGKILRGGVAEERIRVIRTGLDLSIFQHHGSTSREDVRRSLGMPQEACVVGTVSRLYIEKGHRYLLEAVSSLATHLPNLHVLIVGDGPLRPALEAKAVHLGIRDRVTFTGFYDDLPGALASMDIFAQPSVLDEGLPTAVLEAQGAGLPVLASDIGGTKESLDPGKTGVMVRPKDVGALADALAGLAADGIRRKQMGEAARAWVARSFRLDDMVAQVAATYEEALQCRTSA